MRLIQSLTFAALLVLNLSGCQTTMYRALESVGIEKREILVKRVSAARDAQSEAKDQFVSALDRFRALVDVDGGDLERTYDRMNSEYERSQARAKEVSERVDAVEAVAEDLFDEWKNELDQYSDPALRRDSERLLRDTRRRYTGLIASMRRAEALMQPVLNVFRDRVLVLKHNLNAQAVGSLRKELGSIERQTSKLVAEMERAISQADAFISSMKSGG